MAYGDGPADESLRDAWNRFCGARSVRQDWPSPHPGPAQRRRNPFSASAHRQHVRRWHGKFHRIATTNAHRNPHPGQTPTRSWITAVIHDVPPSPLTSICVTPVRRRPGTRAVARACCGTGFQLFSSELLSKTTFWQTTTESAAEQGKAIMLGKRLESSNEGTGQLTSKPS